MKEVEGNSQATIIREVFQNRHDALVNDEKRKILVSHYGTFSQDLVGSLSNSVEELLVSIGDKKIVIKRMFSILLEGLQNIRVHGGFDFDGRQLGFLLIGSKTENYKVIMGNIVHVEEVEKVESDFVWACNQLQILPLQPLLFASPRFRAWGRSFFGSTPGFSNAASSL